MSGQANGNTVDVIDEVVVVENLDRQISSHKFCVFVLFLSVPYNPRLIVDDKIIVPVEKLESCVNAYYVEFEFPSIEVHVKVETNDGFENRKLRTLIPGLTLYIVPDMWGKKILFTNRECRSVTSGIFLELGLGLSTVVPKNDFTTMFTKFAQELYNKYASNLSKFELDFTDFTQKCYASPLYYTAIIHEVLLSLMVTDKHHFSLKPLKQAEFVNMFLAESNELSTLKIIDSVLRLLNDETRVNSVLKACFTKSQIIRNSALALFQKQFRDSHPMKSFSMEELILLKSCSDLMTKFHPSVQVVLQLQQELNLSELFLVDCTRHLSQHAAKKKYINRLKLMTDEEYIQEWRIFLIKQLPIVEGIFSFARFSNVKYNIVIAMLIDLLTVGEQQLDSNWCIDLINESIKFLNKSSTFSLLPTIYELFNEGNFSRAMMEKYFQIIKPAKCIDFVMHMRHLGKQRVLKISQQKINEELIDLHLKQIYNFIEGLFFQQLLDCKNALMLENSLLFVKYDVFDVPFANRSIYSHIWQLIYQEYSTKVDHRGSEYNQILALVENKNSLIFDAITNSKCNQLAREFLFDCMEVSDPIKDCLSTDINQIIFKIKSKDINIEDFKILRCYQENLQNLSPLEIISMIANTEKFLCDIEYEWSLLLQTMCIMKESNIYFHDAARRRWVI